MSSFHSLRPWLEFLAKENQLITIDAPVSPILEIPEIHRRVIERQGPALLFTKVEGSSFPVVTNLFGTEKRVEMAFGKSPEMFIQKVAKLPHELMPPSLKKLWNQRDVLSKALKIGMTFCQKAPVTACQNSNLKILPALTSWPLDAGPFLTLPLVHTQGNPQIDNLGMYRIQIFDKETTGLHVQIGKGGGFHLFEAESQNRNLPVHIYLGGPPSLILSAIAPLPENIPEFLLASLVLGKKLPMTRVPESPLPLVAEAEFCLVGESPCHVRRPEGPFGDHFGYYSWQHDFPIFKLKTLYHRKNPIFPATVVGKPRQEDFYLGDYLQSLLSPLFPLVMPGVQALWSYGETGYHALSAAVLKDRYGREALVSALRILGEGQLSLTKCLIGINKPMDLKQFPQVLVHLLERIQWSRDLYVLSHTSNDTLDYTGGQLNRGSKAILLGLGEPIRTLPQGYEGYLKAKAYVPGCLVVEGRDLQVVQREDVQGWPLLILVDSLEETLKNHQTFLWTVFTRFDPGRDIHAKKVFIQTGTNRIGYEGPILIDCRMKRDYPQEVICDEETKQTVSRRWREYGLS